MGTVPWDTTREEANAELDRADSAVHRKCRELIYAFVGATVDTGTYAWLPAEADWKAGDRSIRCFLWVDDKPVSRSMKGVGRSGWPLK